MKKILLSIIFIFSIMMFTSCFNSNSNNNNNNNNKTNDSNNEFSRIVSIKNDIPVSFLLNDNNEIINVTPENENSEIVLAGDDYSNLSFEEGLNKLLDVSKKCGFDINKDVVIEVTNNFDNNKNNDKKVTEVIKDIAETSFKDKANATNLVSVKTLDLMLWIKILEDSGVELTEEQKSNAAYIWKTVKSFISKIKFTANPTLSAIYQTYIEKELDKALQDAYVEVVNSSDIDSSSANDFREFIKEQNDKYSTNENEYNKGRENLVKAKKYFEEQTVQAREKQAKLKELQDKRDKEYQSNCEKYGEQAAKLMAKSSELLIDAAKIALEAAIKLYDKAKESYEKLSDNYAKEHDGDALTLKNLIGDIKESRTKYLEKNKAIKDIIEKNYETIKERIDNVRDSIKDKFEEDYKEEIDEYYQELLNKKNELIEKFKNEN